VPRCATQTSPGRPARPWKALQQIATT
jgi:hypothetical protein